MLDSRSLTVKKERANQKERKREERKGTVFIGSHPFFLFLLVFFISFIPFQSHISTLCVIKYVPFDLIPLLSLRSLCILGGVSI